MSRCINNGYWIIYKKGEYFREHRLIYEQNYGLIPKGFIVHHKDGNKLNNFPSNLEAIPRGQHKKFHPHTEAAKKQISDSIKKNLPNTIFKSGNKRGHRFKVGEKPAKHKEGCSCPRCTRQWKH